MLAVFAAALVGLTGTVFGQGSPATDPAKIAPAPTALPSVIPGLAPIQPLLPPPAFQLSPTGTLQLAPLGATTLQLGTTPDGSAIDNLIGTVFPGANQDVNLPSHVKFSYAVIDKIAELHFTLTDKTTREEWARKWKAEAVKSKDYAEADVLNQRALHSLGQRFDGYRGLEEKAAFDKRKDPTVVGIGAAVELFRQYEITDAMKDGTTRKEVQTKLVVSDAHPLLLTPMKDSPAAKAGLLEGDKLLKVDGKEINGLGLEGVIDLIRGKENSKVDLTIARKNAAGVYEVLPKPIAVTRGKVTGSAVHTKVLPNGVTYIKFDSFMPDKAAADMLEALKEAAKVKDGKIILDLRDNGGGRLDHAINIVSYMLNSGPIVSLKERGDDQMLAVRHIASPEALLTTRMVAHREGVSYSAAPRILAVPVDMPIIVVTNSNSASASEVLSGALSFNNRAKIVGETTHGKGVGQLPVEIEGRLITITTFFFEPADRATDFEGVHPHRTVSLDGVIKRYEELRKQLLDVLAKLEAAKADPALAGTIGELETVHANVRKELEAWHTMMRNNDPQLEAAQDEAQKELVRIRKDAAELKAIRDEAVRKNTEAWKKELEEEKKAEEKAKLEEQKKLDEKSKLDGQKTNPAEPAKP